MPNIGLRHGFELTTRSQYTKVEAEIGLKVNGSELPNTAVLGEALDKAVQMIQEHITESYKEVPERDGTTEHGREPKTGDARIMPAQPANDHEPAQPTPAAVPEF